MAYIDNVLDFIEEGEMALRDIQFSIKEGFVSSSLSRTQSIVYLNITTSENEKFCIKLDLSGFLVVGREYDTISETEQGATYETVYALLENISHSYTQQFSLQLSERLSQLQQETS